MTGHLPGVVVLISGRGSNLKAILDEARAGRIKGEVRAVISNNPGAPGLDYARAAGVPVEIVNHRDFADRESFDNALAARIDRYAPALVALAGFMRVLGRNFIEHYAGRLINVHPSLLPAFPGLDTHTRALKAGVTRHGATVHFVTPEVDSGPVIAKAEVPVLPNDTPERLAARVLAEEHRLYPQAIGWFLDGRLKLAGNRVLLDNKYTTEQ